MNIRFVLIIIALLSVSAKKSSGSLTLGPSAKYGLVQSPKGKVYVHYEFPLTVHVSLSQVYKKKNCLKNVATSLRSCTKQGMISIAEILSTQRVLILGGFIY